MQPLFKSPLEVPMKYVKHDPLDSHKIIIHYQRWINEVELGNKNWEAALRLSAQKLGVQGTISALIANPPQELLDEVGPRPEVINAEVIRAAEAGNPWIIHEEGEMPPQAAQFFPNYGQEPEPTHITPEGVNVYDPWAAQGEKPVEKPVEEPVEDDGWRAEMTGR
jgi:hypothetical protein